MAARESVFVIFDTEKQQYIRGYSGSIRHVQSRNKARRFRQKNHVSQFLHEVYAIPDGWVVEELVLRYFDEYPIQNFIRGTREKRNGKYLRTTRGWSGSATLQERIGNE